MPLQALILLALKISIVLTVFAVGLRSTTDALMHLFRRPGKLVRSFVAMDVIMPLFALAVAGLTSVPTPVKVALVALSVAPLPPMLPRRTSKVGGSAEYTVALLFT